MSNRQQGIYTIRFENDADAARASIYLQNKGISNQLWMRPLQDVYAVNILHESDVPEKVIRWIETRHGGKLAKAERQF